MGIHGLTKLLADQAPECMKEQKFENYFGRKIAVDASMHIYQFMVVVGRQGDQMLTSETGEVTSHLQGMFYRTTRMLEAGIRPVFVFDGKPPELKRKQLEQRLGRRDEAEEALKAAQEAGNQEDVEKYSKRTVKVTKEHNEECKRLLRLMGVPVVEAASEAEAQCAVMAKAGLVYGVATEDMDALTFGCPRLIRHLMAPSTSNQPINEFDRDKAVAGLKLSDEQFIDFCILCGCDYASNIKGIGPVRALQLLQKHGNMEALLAQLDPAKYPVPDGWPWKEAHAFFAQPDVVQPEDIPALKWSDPDEEGLVQFLVTEKSFQEDRVRKAVGRIKASKGKAQQGRIESFFKPSGVVSSSSIKKPEDKGAAGKAAGGKAGDKRKDEGGKAGPAAKKGKLGGVGGGKKK